jgi:hypothetical protein
MGTQTVQVPYFFCQGYYFILSGYFFVAISRVSSVKRYLLSLLHSSPNLTCSNSGCGRQIVIVHVFSSSIESFYGCCCSAAGFKQLLLWRGVFFPQRERHRRELDATSRRSWNWHCHGGRDWVRVISGQRYKFNLPNTHLRACVLCMSSLWLDLCREMTTIITSAAINSPRGSREVMLPFVYQ